MYIHTYLSTHLHYYRGEKVRVPGSGGGGGGGGVSAAGGVSESSEGAEQAFVPR